MKILYFDCFAGISGDMTVGALLDLGIPLETLQRELAKLPLPLSAYSLSLERTVRRGISAAKFGVKVEEHQPHRHYADIAGMIEASTLAEPVRETAQKIFYRLAEAEAKVHGVEIGHVHFHEVGGIDSIIDIVGTAICLHELGIGEIHASPLPLGSGFVETAHGRLPVPAPATAELLKGIPVVPSGPGERVTPTGAAILAALAAGFGPAPALTVTGIGSGAGDLDFEDVPNVLRLFCGEKNDASIDEIFVIESHLDDCSPEVLGFLMERLLEEGALDAAFSPLQMKKNRPGVRLTVLSPPELLRRLSRLILLESSAIGVRWHPAGRMKLEREEAERETSLGTVKVKVLREGGRVVRIAPEYEECRRIARERSLPLAEVYRLIERETAEP
jgi:pyridinium-3,5-bisthiocarboxylic acid mononucleotide nickel chelatase